MAAINVLQVLPDTNQPVPFTAPFAFSIEYECLQALQDDLEWKMIYVGSAEDEAHDQVLETAEVGPVVQGTFKFVFESDAPDPAKIPVDDLIGVTVILLTCSYKGKEFIRIGYYVNVEYADEQLKENPPDTPVVSALYRTILADHPRVTRFPVDFDSDVAPDMQGMAESMQQDATPMEQDVPMQPQMVF